MNDTEIINQIKSLKSIRPNQDWVFAVKKEVLSTTSLSELKTKRKVTFIQTILSMLVQARPVLVNAMFLFIVFGTLGFIENSLPGDLLYPMKKVAEDSRAVFLVSENDISQYKLSMANKRLEELAKIAEVNQVKKLAPAILAFQANIAEATKSLEKVSNIQELVIESQKLEENKEKMVSLGIIIGGTEEFDAGLCLFAEREIKAIEDQELSEDQEEILIEMKESFEEGDCNESLLKRWYLSNPQEPRQ